MSSPRREGPKPQTTTTVPHKQLDQTSPRDLQEALWTWMCTLPNTSQGDSAFGEDGKGARSVSVVDLPHHIKGPRPSFFSPSDW